MLAAAYWRGRLHCIQPAGCDPSGAIEAMIEAAAECDKDNWMASAQSALS